MLAKIYSGGLNGLESYLVTVEVDAYQQGLPAIIIVGLADKAVAEAKERVLAALNNSSLSVPEHRTIINLAPGDIQKEGTIYDLPIAVGLLASIKIIETDELEKSLFIGELSLDGKLSRIKGALPLALLAKKHGFENIFVPKDNAEELTLVNNLNIYPLRKLTDLVLHLNKQILLKPLITKSLNIYYKKINYEIDFSDILEQKESKRALEIAASGFHNVILNGPPGTGKTLLAKAMSSILPSLTTDEILETTKIYSISGNLDDQKPLILYPPFRSPHHSISRNGLIGGGSKPNPGEISLAHRGILFLDELAEFPRSVLEALRQPLEDGQVVISRANGNATFPTRFMLIAATNPCPCGNLGNLKKRCLCTPTQVMRYKRRLSGPILDRIDLHIFVPCIESSKLNLNNDLDNEKSTEIQKRVVNAREIQKIRFRNCQNKTNGEMGVREVKEYCRLTANAENILKKAIDKYNLSVRTYFKLIKVSQTIADLNSLPIIDTPQIAEALQYRINE